MKKKANKINNHIILYPKSSSMLLYHYKHLLSIKILFLLVGGFLLVIYNTGDEQIVETPPLIFGLQLTDSMNVLDIQQNTELISRRTAAQQIITDYIDQSHPQQNIGLIGFDDTTRSYLIPPTTDHNFFSHRLALYHSQTYLGTPKFTSLHDVIADATLIIIGDGGTADNIIYTSLASIPPQNMRLITLGSSKGDIVRNAEGDTIIQNNIPLMHARNDQRYSVISPGCCTPTALLDDIQDLSTTPPATYTLLPTQSKNTPLRASILIALGL